jgi:hypothetical protein
MGYLFQEKANARKLLGKNMIALTQVVMARKRLFKNTYTSCRIDSPEPYWVIVRSQYEHLAVRREDDSVDEWYRTAMKQ